MLQPSCGCLNENLIDKDLFLDLIVEGTLFSITFDKITFTFIYMYILENETFHSGSTSTQKGKTKRPYCISIVKIRNQLVTISKLLHLIIMPRKVIQWPYFGSCLVGGGIPSLGHSIL